jgi:hypothetical protein
MALPLVTSFAVAGVTAPALIALAVVAGFVMHEPLSVLLGRRGACEQRAQWRRAAMWLGTTAIRRGVVEIDVPSRVEQRIVDGPCFAGDAA